MAPAAQKARVKDSMYLGVSGKNDLALTEKERKGFHGCVPKDLSGSLLAPRFRLKKAGSCLPED